MLAPATRKGLRSIPSDDPPPTNLGGGGGAAVTGGAVAVLTTGSVVAERGALSTGRLRRNHTFEEALGVPAVGRAYDLVNPFSAAVNAYGAVIIDSQPIGAQMLAFSLVIAWLCLTMAAASLAFRRVAL